MVALLVVVLVLFLLGSSALGLRMVGQRRATAVPHLHEDVHIADHSLPQPPVDEVHRVF